MDLYHSWLTPDDLTDLIIKYKIPRDLHPQLPLEEFRHLDAAINDPRPAAGSFSMADVRRLSAHGADGNVMGIHDFLCLSKWTGFEVQEEPHHDIRPTLQRLPFYCTPPAAADIVILDPTLEDLAIHVARTPSEICNTDEWVSWQTTKRKASTSGATSSHVVKRTRSALAQLSGSTTYPSLFVGDSDDESDGDDDAYSRGKGIMVDDAAASSVGASRPTLSSGPALSFRDVSGDAIHADIFPFSAGPYYATYPKCSVAGNCEFTHEEWDAPYWPTFEVLTKEVFNDPAICKTMVDQFPTPEEMVRFESLSDEQLTAKMSVLHCLMMSHGGELLARYHGLNQSHHEYVLSEDSRMKGYEEKVASFTGLELQVSSLKKQVSGLNDKLSSFDASFAKSKAKGKDRKKKIKSFTKSLDNLHTEDSPDCEDSRACSIHKSFTSSASFWESSIQI
ncbi:hypothetical protein Tco_0905007 [Tanacetum coccineum]